MSHTEQATWEWCYSCKQWLKHDTRRCPLFNKVEGYEKWSRCVCLVHTCYLETKDISPDDARIYRDFP